MRSITTYSLILAAILQLSTAIFPFYNIKPFNHEPSKDLGAPLILTPYIQAGQIEEAKNASRVSSTRFGNVTSYSGYFTVDETVDANLFFWFFPAASGSDKAPVLLWLQGGPGVSSLFGLFGENGPFVVQGANLSSRDYSWHKDYNLIYIDQPIGTGYSFTNGSLVTDQTQVGQHLYRALTQFFTVFSEYQNNSFFVSGESYGGKYVPAISYTIHKNNPKAQLKINLEGVIIGNGLSDPERQFKYGQLLYQLGLIDTLNLKEFEAVQDLIVSNIQTGNYRIATDFWNLLVDAMFNEKTGLPNIYNFVRDASDPDDWVSFVVSDEIRQALHVGNQRYSQLNDDVYAALYEDITKSVAPWVSELLSHYRVLVYNGQLDIIVGYVLTENYLEHLEFSAAEEYATADRTIWTVDDRVAGYIKRAGNLTEALVRDAGHMVPADQPEFAYDLISRFIKNQF